jgi:hypothetical protein
MIINLGLMSLPDPSYLGLASLPDPSYWSLAPLIIIKIIIFIIILNLSDPSSYSF